MHNTTSALELGQVGGSVREPSWMSSQESPFSKTAPGRELASEERDPEISFPNKGFANGGELLLMNEKNELVSANKEENQQKIFLSHR